MNYKPFIGLETHIELSTTQKMFCGCSANYFAKKPNSLTCPVCLGLPGALPVPNKEAIEWTILLGLALNCKINTESFFERKHYFYPDLPKGYQISQYQKPLCFNGFMLVNDKKIHIRRIHIEEDTGKLLHGQQFKDPQNSYIDFNRSGVPLVEIVTEPDFDTPELVVEYLKKLQLIVRYLGISDCDMEKGSMRIEPNISIGQKNKQLPNYKVEIKNINSFKFAKHAINYEIKRQTLLLEQHKTPKQETRRYLESSGKTEVMRSKEEAHDYRYFPEPDIPPIILNNKLIQKLKKQLAAYQLPERLYKKLTKDYKIAKDIAQILVENKQLGDLFFKILKLDKTLEPAKLATYLVNNKSSLSKQTISQIVVKYKQTTIKQKLDPALVQKTVQEIIKDYPQAVKDYQRGKKNALQFLLGQCLKKIGKQIEVKEVITKLKESLGK